MSALTDESQKQAVQLQQYYTRFGWEAAEFIEDGSGKPLFAYNVTSHSGRYIVASDGDAQALTSFWEPVGLSLYLSEAMDGMYLSKGFLNSWRSIAFVERFKDEILKAFILYGQLEFGNTVNQKGRLPSDIELVNV